MQQFQFLTNNVALISEICCHTSRRKEKKGKESCVNQSMAQIGSETKHYSKVPNIIVIKKRKRKSTLHPYLTQHTFPVNQSIGLGLNEDEEATKTVCVNNNNNSI